MGGIFRKLCLLLSTLAVLLAATACNCKAPSSYHNEYTDNPRPVVMDTHVVPIYVDKDFSYPHLKDIREALAQWNIAMNGYEQFEIVTEKFDMEPDVLKHIFDSMQGIVILSRKSEDADIQQMPDGVLGFTPSAPAQVVNLIEDRIGTRNLRIILLHELGHALGLMHITVSGTLMFPAYPYDSPCIDKSTVVALAFTRRWDWHHMNWCEWPR